MTLPRILPSLTLALVASLALVACAPDVVSSPSVTLTEVPAQNRVAAPAPPEDPTPEQVWPLTGLSSEGASEEELTRPALAIKIENSEDAHPQMNLHRADTVFEEYVEAGIPRLVAIFHSDYPDEVGPIRSVRPMDQFIMGSYGGPLIFSGGQYRFVAQNRSDGTPMIGQDMGDDGFFRVKIKRAPHNVHGDLEVFRAQVPNLTAPDPHFAFAYPADYATASVSGKPAKVIDINMSRYAQPVWRWNVERELWLREEFGKPHVMTDGTQIYANNVIMLWVAIKDNRGVPETIMIKTNGNGFVASDGKYIPVKWTKSSRTSQITLTTADGEPVLLTPGNTWVELVPYAGVRKGTIDFLN